MITIFAAECYKSAEANSYSEPDAAECHKGAEANGHSEPNAAANGQSEPDAAECHKGAEANDQSEPIAAIDGGLMPQSGRVDGDRVHKGQKRKPLSNQTSTTGVRLSNLASVQTKGAGASGASSVDARCKRKRFDLQMARGWRFARQPSFARSGLAPRRCGVVRRIDAGTLGFGIGRHCFV